MSSPDKDNCFDSIKEIEVFLDKMLESDQDNEFALYGKSLILFQQGKIEESSETLNQCKIEGKRDLLREKLTELLEAKHEVKVEVLPELRKKFSELKNTKPFLLNFMSFPEPEIPKVTYVSKLVGPVTSTSFREVKNEKSCFCIICKKTFTKMFSLNRHMQIHTGEKSHVCSVCGHGFIQKVDCQRHETSHSSEFNIICSFEGCERKFKTVKSMRSHLIVHSNARPFKCHDCLKEFKTSRSLRNHEGVHKDLKEFICNNCDKGFSSKPSLKSHMKVHSTDRPFCCPYCSSSFKRRYDMHCHIRKHHEHKDSESEESKNEGFIIEILN